MCEYWNISRNVYERRINRGGWSLEKSLTTPVDLKDTYIDPISGEEMRAHELIKKYKLTRNAHLKTKLKTCSIAQAIGISISVKPRYNNINMTKYNLTIANRIKPGENVFECYIDNDDGTSTFKIMNQEMIDEYCIQKYKEEHGIQ